MHTQTHNIHGLIAITVTQARVVFKFSLSFGFGQSLNILFEKCGY